MKTNSECLDQILEFNQKVEGLIILRLVVIIGQLNKSETYQIFLKLALQIMAKASLTFPLVHKVERIILVLAVEPLVHV